MEDRCPGNTFRQRYQPPSGTRILYQCKTCGRVNRTVRPHRKAGPTTASHDKTMAILWDAAATTPEGAHHG